MTSDLEQIAEEMEESGQEAEIADLPSLAKDLRDWAADIRAWIAANKESPASLQFQHETLRNSRGCPRCMLVSDAERLMAEPINAPALTIEESPQRKAFVEAAANCCKIHLEYSEGPDVGNWLRRSSKEMLHAYRAMVEAEKVEVE